MTLTDALQRDYRVAFLSYLSSRDEGPLTVAYELGRRAVTEGLSILELSRIHHEVFRLVIQDTRSAELDEVVEAASEFFLEVLATYHMIHAQTA